MNIGETMARVLRCAVNQQFTSVRSLARDVYRTRNNREPIVRTNHPVLNELRAPEQAVNRCQRAGLLGDNLRPTNAGLMALARSALGQDIDGVAMAIHFAQDEFDNFRPLLNTAIDLCIADDPEAKTFVAFAYWHGRMYGPRPSDRARARSSLGGKGGSDRRQTVLPLEVPASPGVERANTGAPPQPPYIHCTCNQYDAIRGDHHALSCDMATTLPRIHHAKQG